MTFRYNPQSIEKQVRKWPVLFSEKDLHKDICNRVNQILQPSDSDSAKWLNPFCCQLPFDDEYIFEYGMDACRLAAINIGNQPVENILESSFKWLAKLHDALSKDSNQTFNPKPWLEALLQLEDHVIQRNCDRLGLALVMKAFKESTPNSQITSNEKLLIAAAIQPFAPIYAASKIVPPDNIPSMSDILKHFETFHCVKIALERGGWHWQVFNRKDFENNPESELQKLKWIKKAVKNNKIVLKKEAGGLRVCFS